MSANFSNNPLDTVQSILINSIGNTTLATCTAANLPSGQPGYAVGCIAMASDTGVCYSNTGSITSSTFTAFNSASALTLPSAFTDSATTTGNSMLLTESTLTTGNGIKVLGTTANFTTGGALFRADLAAAVAGNGFVGLTTGVYTGTGLLTLTATAATTGTIGLISAAGLTTGFGMTILTGTALTTGSNLKLDMGAATAGNGLNIVSTGVYITGSTGLISVTANSATTTTGLVQISGTGLTSGAGLLITGGGANMTSAGVLLNMNLGAAIAGSGLDIITTGVYTDTTGLFSVTANSATTGTLTVHSGTGITTGKILSLVGTAATMTTGRYITVNDSATEVFGIGLNGHLISAQTTAPVMTTNSTGISATVIVAGSSDTCGSFTTTGTPSSGTVLTCTFNKTYTTAPKAVMISPINAAAGGVNTMPIIATTATTFTLTWPAGGVYAATPSYSYLVVA